MNGKKYSTSRKHPIGHFRSSFALLFTLVTIGLLTTVILTAAASYQPSTIAIEEEQPYVAATAEIDIEYIRLVTRQEAIAMYYSNLVGSEEIATLVLAAAREYGITDVEILFALMWKESMFLPTAINYNSQSTDRGLFQLNSAVYAKYPAEQFFDTEWNIRTGVRHYATELAITNGNHQIALHAYNAGRSRRYSPPPSTEAYAIEILQIAQQYRHEKSKYIQSILDNRLSMYKGDL